MVQILAYWLIVTQITLETRRPHSLQLVIPYSLQTGLSLGFLNDNAELDFLPQKQNIADLLKLQNN